MRKPICLCGEHTETSGATYITQRLSSHVRPWYKAMAETDSKWLDLVLVSSNAKPVPDTCIYIKTN